MFLAYNCNKCGGHNLGPIDQVLPQWKKNYEAILASGENTTHFNLFIECACPFCREVKIFRGPIFQYMFEVLFNTLVLKGKSKING